MKRDSQRSKVYRAQWRSDWWAAMHKYTWTFENARDFALLVLAENNGPRMRIRKARGNAVGSWVIQDEMVLRKEHFNPAVVLHEAAHVLAGMEHGHNRIWARKLLDLVFKYFGKGARDDLKAAFKSGGVKYSRPRKVSAERRRKLQEHADRIRALKREGEVISKCR